MISNPTGTGTGFAIERAKFLYFTIIQLLAFIGHTPELYKSLNKILTLLALLEKLEKNRYSVYFKGIRNPEFR